MVRTGFEEHGAFIPTQQVGKLTFSKLITSATTGAPPSIMTMREPTRSAASIRVPSMSKSDIVQQVVCG